MSDARDARRTHLLAVIAALLASHCTEATSPPPTSPATPVVSAGPEAPAIPFREVAQALGIDSVQRNGAAGSKLLPETMGSGCAFFDYDGDDALDVLIIHGRAWSAKESSRQSSVELFRNARGHFDNVTTSVGLRVDAYATGVAIGDVDGDGRDDVFVTGVGQNHLLHNTANGFVDITAAAGVAGDPSAWGTGTGFFDYDRDGDLDLFVLRYVTWSAAIDAELGSQLTGVGRAYGPPTNFAGAPPALYRNDGHGHFEDVSEASGVRVRHPTTGAYVAKALGLSFIDVNDDHYPDIFVGNDTTANQLFVNQRDGTFRDQGTAFGVAYDSQGRATGAMGVDAAFFRNDSSLALAVGNFADEMTSLYVRQLGGQQFGDETLVEGLGGRSRVALTFGTLFFDADLDGNLDFLQVNGHLEEAISKVRSDQRYEQAPQLFWNRGAGPPRFVLAKQTGDLDAPVVGRSASYADIDGDGDLDVLITQPGRAVRLYRNEQNTGHTWLRVRLSSPTPGAREGAIVSVQTPEGTQRRIASTTRSYLAQTEPTMTFGLGKQSTASSVTVAWPDGTTTTMHDVPANQVLRIAASNSK